MTAIARSKLNHSLVCCVLVRYVTAKARSKLDHSLVCCVLVRSICDCYSTWSRDKLNHPFTWHDCANDTKMDSPTHLPILSHTATPTYPPTHIRPHPLTHPPIYGHTHLPAHPHTATPTNPSTHIWPHPPTRPPTYGHTHLPAHMHTPYRFTDIPGFVRRCSGGAAWVHLAH